MLSDLEECLGAKVPQPLEGEEARQFLIAQVGWGGGWRRGGGGFRKGGGVGLRGKEGQEACQFLIAQVGAGACGLYGGGGRAGEDSCQYKAGCDG
jgi:hypothetical protein